MKIEYNGKIIKLDANEDLDEMLKLVCVCGHTLGNHSFTHGFGTHSVWITSQCASCGFTKKDNEHPQGFVCEQFRINPAKNDARWFNFPGIGE